MTKFIKNNLITFLYWVIKLIEKFEYRNLNLDEENIDDKIIDTISLDEEFFVQSDIGLVPVTHIHLTQPYTHYDIELENGIKLSCADIHILFDKNLKEIYAKDLQVGNFLSTIDGNKKVIKVKKTNRKTSMGDLSIDHPSHRYYTNGILSHNTISSSIFMLHTILFNNDKNVMIVANKGDTATEIVDKIKSIYTLLPFFLKPGVKTWNQKSLTFENGCRIKTSARTKTPAIGFTIDLLYLDEFAHIPSNIIEPYYTAAFPTVSAIKNSKIIITSTPNGMNLFHKILTNAERPDGDPQKNNFKATRVYWHQVPGRFVTYLRLNDHKLYENKLKKEDILKVVNDKWGSVTKVKMGWNIDIQKDVISIFNNDKCKDEDIKGYMFENGDGVEISFHNIAEVTTWKEEAIKDIGGEDAFNQEYGLRFINASKSLLNEAIIEDLLNQKIPYEYKEIDEFSNLRFSYENLKWIKDSNIYVPSNRKEYKIVMSIDLSEGLGQDYSVINIFKVANKSKELIELQKDSYTSIVDFFKLDQIGLYRSNIVSLKQMAEIIYLLSFEYFDPENVRIVLELNNYGNTLLSEMPHVFDGKNDYGSSIFVRYKHRVDSPEEKIGLKVNKNKKLLIKDYQDRMASKSFHITNQENIHEITTFVKHKTAAGNIKYAADVGNDDCVMSVVNASSIFEKNEFKEICEDYLESYVDSETKEYINECLKNSDYFEAIDYGSFLKTKRKYINSKTFSNKVKSRNNGSNWFNI